MSPVRVWLVGPVSCGDFVGSCFRRQVPCRPERYAHRGSGPPRREEQRDAGDVKCLAGAVNFVRTGGSRGACPVCGALAGVRAVSCRP